MDTITQTTDFLTANADLIVWGCILLGTLLFTAFILSILSSKTKTTTNERTNSTKQGNK